MPLNPPITDWTGRRAWLVGASSGIGRATASLLHRRGAQVVVSARNQRALANFVAEHPGATALAVLGMQRASELFDAMPITLAIMVESGSADCPIRMRWLEKPSKAKL